MATRPLYSSAPPRIDFTRGPSAASRMTISAASRSVPSRGGSRVDDLVAHARSVTSTFQPPPEQHKAPSLFEQFRGLVGGVVPGLIRFGTDIAQDVVATPRLLFDLAKDRQLHGGFEHYLPASTGLVQSFGRTGYDITHPGEFAKAVREGTIVGKIAEDVGNAAIVFGAAGKALGVTGLATVEGTAGEARALGQGAVRPVGAAVAEDLPRAATLPLRAEAERALHVVEPGSIEDVSRMAPPEATTAVGVRARGIAGRLAKSGNIDTALKVERAGQIASRIGSLGTEAAMAPARIYTYPLEKIGEAFGIEGGPLAAASRAVVRHVEAKGPESFLYRFTAEGRAESAHLSQIKAAAERSGVDAKRWAVQPAHIAAEHGLSISEGRAVLLAVDNPGFFAKATRGIHDDTELGRIMDIAYQHVPEVARPTVEDARVAQQYADRTLPADTLQAMDAAQVAQREISRQNTQRMLELGIIKEEQTQPLLRESSIAKTQQRYAGVITRATREIDRLGPGAIRARRIANAVDAVAAELPEPPRAREEFARGRAQGVAEARDTAARAEHRRAQRDLAAAVDEYVRLTESDAAPPRLAAAEKQLDALIGREQQIRDLIDQQVRRSEAAQGLSRVSGKFAPGARRVVDANGQVVDVAVNRTQPEAAPEGQPRVGEVRARAAELNQGVVEGIRREIDRMTHGERPERPRRRGKVGGEHDFWEQVSAKTRRRLYREGWFVKAGEGIGVDELGDYMGMNPDQAAMAYIERIQQLWDQQGSKGEGFSHRIAEEMGLTREAVHSAITGRIGDYKGLLASQPVQLMDELRSDYQAMLPDERAVLDDTVRQYEAQGVTDPEEWATVLEGYLGADRAEIDTLLAGNQVDIHELVKWVQTGDVITSQRAEGAVRTAAQNQQLGRLAGEVTGLRAQLADVRGAQGVSIAEIQRSIAEQERAQAAAAAGVDTATERANRKSPVQGPKIEETYRPGDDSLTRRYGDATMSPAERLRFVQGQRRAQAAYAEQRVARLERTRANAVDRMGDVRNELGRSFQDRVAEDLNAPAVNSMVNAIRKGGQTLGGLAGRGLSATLTGLVGRLATRYGIYDAVLERISAMHGDIARQSLFPDELGEPGVIGPSQVAGAFEDALQASGRVLDRTDGIQFHDSVEMEKLTSEMRTLAEEEAAGGRRLSSPLRVIDLVRNSEWNMPSDVRSTFEARAERYLQRRGSILAKVFDNYAEAMPAMWRTVHAANRRVIGALLVRAEELNREHPGSGDTYFAMAEETATTLDQMVKDGLDPAFLTGGKEAGVTPSGLGGRGGLGQSKLRATSLRRTGLRPLSIADYARLQADQASRLVRNRVHEYVMKPVEEGGFGRRADSLPGVATAIDDWAATHNGEPMPTADLAKVTTKAGWVPAEGADVARDTLLVPHRIMHQLEGKPMEGLTNSTAWKALRRGNQMWKTWILPFSAKWVVGNIVGNAIMAAVHGGVGLVELGRRMRDIVRAEGGGMEGLRRLWDQDGVPAWGPNELANHGLSFQEWRLMNDYMDEHAPRTLVGRGISKGAGVSYKLNSFVDNMTRSAVYLSKLGDGVPREAALNMTLKALGDFTRMNPIERNIIRQVMPFYAWLRHQTTAIMRLPINSPGRAAFLLKVSSMYQDPNLSGDLLSLIGSRIPLGGSLFLDAGSLNPLPDVTGLPFDPRNIGQAISPFIKFGTTALTGFDLNTWDQVKRPAGTFARGPFGQERATPPLFRILTNPAQGLGELGYIATQQAPPSIRAIRDLVLGNEQRYAAGYQVGNLTNPNLTAPRILLRGLGLPGPYTIDIAGAGGRKASQIARQRG